MFEARGALVGIGWGEDSSAAGVFGSTGGVDDIIDPSCAVVGCAVVDVGVMEDFAANSGKSAGGGYFLKKRRSWPGSVFASCAGFAVVLIFGGLCVWLWFWLQQCQS